MSFWRNNDIIIGSRFRWDGKLPNKKERQRVKISQEF